MKDPVVIIDAGANSNCSPNMLFQFAVMGTTFSKNVLGIEKPRVGVLNIGEEAGKGNELAQSTYKLLEQNQDKINFVGNIEGREIFSGACNVIVCDGFVGNVALKITEGTSSMLFNMLKQEFKSDPLAKIAGLIAYPFMKRIYKKINYEEFGGALLLGVKGITIISHGRSKAYAVKRAIKVAKEAVETGVNKKIEEFLEGTSLAD
jgi:glycerol-3-phosphate acyltransferase PlsX